MQVLIEALESDDELQFFSKLIPIQPKIYLFKLDKSNSLTRVSLSLISTKAQQLPKADQEEEKAG